MTLPVSLSKGERKERTALLQTTYFGPIQWYQKLNRFDRCIIEQYDSYQKQTFRNRCIIATANGPQVLTVPVEHETINNKQEIIKTKDLRISDHNQWRRVHWNALVSAYSESPFFDYYVDDIRPFFEKKYAFLVDFNEEIRQTICGLIDIHPHVEYSSFYSPPMQESTIHSPHLQGGAGGGSDFRDVIHAKHPQPDPDFESRPYWQVFQHKIGFRPNLSILDLLFNMGPESIFYL
jgi:hypothetical protein